MADQSTPQSTPQSTRERIASLADQLFYEQGYEHTSFADIAKAVDISRGNFYYHFKTKDEILAAVIQVRAARTQALLDQWQTRGADPAERIRCFIQMLVANRTRIKRHGCPVGTLCTELAKMAHPAKKQANQLFMLFRAWLRRQFAELGCAEDADVLAMHLLARSQGVATLAHAFNDDAFIRQEVQQMLDWLQAIVDRAVVARASR